MDRWTESQRDIDININKQRTTQIIGDMDGQRDGHTDREKL